MVDSLFGLFLVIHGLVHLTWLAPKPDDPRYPFRLSRSRLFPKAHPEVLSVVGAVLVVVGTTAFVVAGLGLWDVPVLESIWRPAAAVGAVTSLATVALFWHHWLAAGPILDIAILVAVALNWPHVY